MKVAAGLSKLFRPAAPSTVRTHHHQQGPSKGRSRKGNRAMGGGGGEESISDSSSVIGCGKDGDYLPLPTGVEVIVVSTLPPHPHVTTSADKSLDPCGSGHGGGGNAATEWSQLPGAIPDTSSDDSDEQVTKPRTAATTTSTPPISRQKKSNKPPSLPSSSPHTPAKLNGDAISLEEIDKVPQAGKKYVRDVRAKRVMKEYRCVKKLCNQLDATFNVELVDENLYDWNIKLYEMDPLSLLHYDMEKYDIPFVLFNMTFPDNFPFSPPFVRVVSPRIDNGYVMDGGAICMELLTPGGWSSAYTIEAIVMQLGATLVAGHARVSTGKRYKIFGDVPFNKQEAADSFRNVVETHKRYGWATPAGDFS